MTGARRPAPPPCQPSQAGPILLVGYPALFSNFNAKPGGGGPCVAGISREETVWLNSLADLLYTELNAARTAAGANIFYADPQSAFAGRPSAAVPRRSTAWWWPRHRATGRPTRPRPRASIPRSRGRCATALRWPRHCEAWGCDRPAAAGRVRPLPQASRAGAVGGDQDDRDKAEQTRAHMEQALGSGQAADPLAALELGRAELQASVASDGRSRVLGSASRPDGSVQFDLALVGGAQTGGGLTYEAAAVLLCTRLTVTPGHDPRAALADLTCPSSLTSPGSPLHGLVDQAVTLQG